MNNNESFDELYKRLTGTSSSLKSQKNTISEKSNEGFGEMYHRLTGNTPPDTQVNITSSAQPKNINWQDIPGNGSPEIKREFASLLEDEDQPSDKSVVKSKSQTSVKSEQANENLLASFVDAVTESFSKYRAKVKADTERKNQERLTPNRSEQKAPEVTQGMIDALRESKSPLSQAIASMYRQPNALEKKINDPKALEDIAKLKQGNSTPETPMQLIQKHTTAPGYKPSWGETLGYSTLGGLNDAANAYMNIPVLAEKVIDQGAQTVKNAATDLVDNLLYPPSQAARMMPKKQKSIEPTKLTWQNQQLENSIKHSQRQQAVLDQALAKAPTVQRTVGNIARANAAMVPAIALGGATGMTPAVFGTQFGSQYAQEAEAEGASPTQALMYGVIGGTVETISGGIMERIAKRVGGKSALIRTLKDLVSEGVEEVVANPITVIAKHVIYGNPNNDPIWDWGRELDAFVTGVGAAGTFAAPVGAINIANMPKRKQNLKTRMVFQVFSDLMKSGVIENEKEGLLAAGMLVQQALNNNGGVNVGFMKEIAQLRRNLAAERRQNKGVPGDTSPMVDQALVDSVNAAADVNQSGIVPEPVSQTVAPVSPVVPPVTAPSAEPINPVVPPAVAPPNMPPPAVQGQPVPQGQVAPNQPVNPPDAAPPNKIINNEQSQSSVANVSEARSNKELLEFIDFAVNCANDGDVITAKGFAWTVKKRVTNRGEEMIEFIPDGNVPSMIFGASRKPGEDWKISGEPAAFINYQPGDQIVDKAGREWTVVDANDESMLTVKNTLGTETKIGRGAVAGWAGEMQAATHEQAPAAPISSGNRETKPESSLIKTVTDDEKNQKFKTNEKVNYTGGDGKDHTGIIESYLPFESATAYDIRDEETGEVVTIDEIDIRKFGEQIKSDISQNPFPQDLLDKIARRLGMEKVEGGYRYHAKNKLENQLSKLVSLHYEFPVQNLDDIIITAKNLGGFDEILQIIDEAMGKTPESKPEKSFSPDETESSLVKTITDKYLAMGWKPDVAEKCAKLLADAIEKGTYTDLLHPRNSKSRAIYEELTGKKLPKTAKDTVAMVKGIYEEPKKYRIITNDGIKTVDGYPVKAEGSKNEFFVHKTPFPEKGKPPKWAVSEKSTGKAATWGCPTRAEAEAEFQKTLEERGTEFIDNVIEKTPKLESATSKEAESKVSETPRQNQIAPMNVAELKKALIDINQGRVSEEQADALIELVKGAAKYKGISVEQYIQERIAGLEQGGELPENALASPLNPDVDPDQRVNVVDISNALPFKKVVSNKALLGFLHHLAKKNMQLSSADQKVIFKILPEKAAHITYSSRKGLTTEQTIIRKGSLASIVDLMKNAVLIESQPNIKKSKKPDVDYYHYFYVPVSANGKIFTIKLVAEEKQNVITVNPTEVALYDVIQANEKPAPYNRHTSQRSTGMGTPTGLSITIRQMLKDVKDSQKNPFFPQQVDGTIKAAVAFDADNKAIVHAFQASNVADMAHELAHIFRRDLTPEDMRIAADWAGAKDGEWDRDSEENFAKGFEAYLLEGKAPNSRLKRIFEQFKEWLLSIYRHLRNSIKLTSEIRQVFDRLVSGNEVGKTTGLEYNGDKGTNKEVGSDGSVGRTPGDRSGSVSVRVDGTGTLEKISSENVPRDESKRDVDSKGVRSPGTDDGHDRDVSRKRIEHGSDSGDRSATVHPAGTGKGEQVNKAAAKLKGDNYVITAKDAIGTGTEGERLRNNVEAIKIIKKLEAENRPATKEEQAALVKYVGWGGLSAVFDDISGKTLSPQMQKAQAELKELLTKEEYEAARASTKNAHYTGPEVIKAMYEGLKHLGFSGGYVLEPSAGVGHFLGLMPPTMAQKSHVTAIELDKITGAILKALYPNSDTKVMGFQEADLSPIYDVAISNIPFGDYMVSDLSIPKEVRQQIHNYFFAKALERVRSGGLVMFITSTGTMDSKQQQNGSGIREYIDRRANFIGAIRLPNTTFKGNAGTEVVTDIIVLQKHGEGVTSKPQSWGQLCYQPSNNGYGGGQINEYYKKHPEMVLGQHSWGGSMYRANSYTVEGNGTAIGPQIVAAFKKMQKNIVVKPKAVERITQPKAEDMIPAPDYLQDGSFTIQDGKLFLNEKGQLTPTTVSAKDTDRMSRQVEMIRTVKELMSLQYGDGSEAVIKDAQAKLSKQYDDYVAKHGPLHTRIKGDKMANDPEYYRLLSIENWDSEKQSASKADIFSKRTIVKYEPPTSADTAVEALTLSLNEKGVVDVDYMMELTGKPVEKIVADLGDKIFLDPATGQYETDDAYLSGNVRAKLKVAKSYAALEPQYQRNVEALEKNQPVDLPPARIKARPGSAWIPVETYQEFIKSIFGETAGIVRRPGGNYEVMKSWSVLRDANLREEWGTKDRNFLEIFENILNQQKTEVYYTDSEGRRILDTDKSAAAMAKQEKILNAFKEWIWKDVDRAEKLARLYNDTQNVIKLREWNGSHLTFPGMNPVWAERLRPHQKNAVWRFLQGGNALFAHAVGAGKTFEMIASAMEAKRLGIVKKSVMVVPKHLVAQTGQSILELYPGAKILVATDTSFSQAKDGKNHRKEFIARIATNDWDIVILSHADLKKIPMGAEAIREFYRERLDQLELTIRQEVEAGERSDKGLVKRLEKMKSDLQARMEEEIAKIRKQQDVGNLTWEETGIDGLILDEAHEFKNLYFYTRLQGVSGLGSTSGVQKTTDLYMKVRHLQKLNHGRGIAFATGTPIANSIAELYHMQRYLDPWALEKQGIDGFDAWASQFAEVVPEFEMNPSGSGYRFKDRLSKFINLPVLKQMFRSYADVQTAEMLHLPVPELFTGGTEEISAEPSQELLDYIQGLGRRADAIKGQRVQKGGDNILVINNDGRKASLDMRLVRPGLPDNPDSKVNLTVDKLVELYHESAKERGVQIVFLDLSTPNEGTKKGIKAETVETEETDAEAGLSDEEKALKTGDSAEAVSVYQDIKNKLIAKGIPETEIVFVHEANTMEKRKKLFASTNAGKIRILIGSTAKLGTGANIQERAFALYNLDAPWKPAEVEQRIGRILRQGNRFPKVHVFNVITKKSFDARTWNILKMKDRSIRSIYDANMEIDEVTDSSGLATVDYAEISAIASDNPDIMRDIELDNKIAKYRAIQGEWQNQRQENRRRERYLPEEIARQEKNVAYLKELLAKRQEFKGDKFSITLGKKTFSNRDEADEALKKLDQEDYVGPLGTFAGFKIASVRPERGKGQIIVLDTPPNKVEWSFGENNAPVSASLSVGSLEYAARNLEKALADKEEKLRRLKKELEAVKNSLDKPFEYERELTEAVEESAALKRRLSSTESSKGQTASELGLTALEQADAEIKQRLNESGAKFREGGSDSTAIAAGTFKWFNRIKNAINALFGDDSNQVKVSDSRVERMLNATKSPLNLRQQLRSAIQNVSTAFKDVFEYEWTVKEFPQFQDELRRFKGVARDAQKFALDKLVKITSFLESPKEYEIFRRLVFLRDLKAGIEEKEAEAFAAARRMGYEREEAGDIANQAGENIVTTGELTISQIEKAIDELWGQTDEHTQRRIEDALWAHDKTFEALWEDLQERGKVPANAKHRESYVPHRVLDYMGEVDKRFPALSRRFKTPYRYYLQKRTGSTRLIDTDYTALTLKHFAKLYMDNAYDDFNFDIAAKYDKYIRMSKEERQGLGKLTPGRLYEVDGEQYRAWQYDPGRNFYLQESLTEETVMEILQDVLDPEIKPEDRQLMFEAAMSRAMSGSKKFLAIGKHKRIYLLPVDIADRLTHFKSADFNSRVLNAVRSFHHYYKMVLFSPITLGIPFHVNNAFGDTINLIRDDPEAMMYLKDAWQAVGEWQSGLVSPRFVTVVELAEKYRVAEAALMKNSGMPFHPKLKQLQPKRYIGRNLNPLTKWNNLAERRELTPRFAKLMADLKRIERGEMPVAQFLDVKKLAGAGMNTLEIAGKLAREITVDYDKLTPEGKLILRDIALPFFTFYAENFGNWFKYVKRKPGNFAAKFMVPLLAMILWNWFRFPDEEEKLPVYYRIAPHIITGFKDKDGKMIIWSMQTPVEMAARITGLDVFPDLVRQVASGKKTASAAAGELAKSVALGPWDTAKDLLTPLFKAPIEAFGNKSWFNGRPIVPREAKETPDEWKYKVKYIIGQWFAPAGNWSRNAKDDTSIGHGLGSYLRKGPVDIPRAVGFRRVNLGQEQIGRFYNLLNELEGEYKQSKNAGQKFKDIGKLRRMRHYSSQFSKWYKTIDRIEKSKMSEKAKTQMTDKYKKVIAEKAEAVLKAVQ